MPLSEAADMLLKRKPIISDVDIEMPTGGVLLLQAHWYSLVANAEFMLHDVQNEAFAEQLRERKRLYGEKDMKQDFFLVSEPTWLEKQFPEDVKKVKRPCVALVSTDKIWITSAALSLSFLCTEYVAESRTPTTAHPAILQLDIA